MLCAGPSRRHIYLAPGQRPFQIYAYVRKDTALRVALKIEGTQSSLSDLLMFEADPCPGRSR